MTQVDLTPKPSLSMQRQAVEHIIAIVENDIGGTIVDAAKHAALTLGFLERHDELTAMLRRLHSDAPDVFKALSEITKAFPEARMVRAD